ncbi:MAG: S1C family serine protease [Firmicutes bacterium]|nr:S1C family serine protease [Bacillota bacterium]
MKKLFLIFAASIISIALCFSASACGAMLLPVPGKSAYEIARDNGFTGTEQDWLDSLKGVNGLNGLDAAGFSIYELYDAYLVVHPGATFADFLKEFSVVGYLDTEYAVARAVQSAVKVESTFTVRSGGQNRDASAQGAGVVYKLADGYAYIITNYHMVYDKSSTDPNGLAKKIEVWSYAHEIRGKYVSAEFVGGSIAKDIAVVKAQTADFSGAVAAAQIADSNGITLGEKTVAVGNPSGMGISASSGIISVDSEIIEMTALDAANSTQKVEMRVMRTDAAINKGNSGGGLFNGRGELIGIVNAKIMDVENIGFAIPVNVAAGIADCVIDNNSEKCMFGITTVAQSTQTQYNSAKNKVEIIETVAVHGVTAGGLADEKLSAGDKLKAARVNGGALFQLTRNFHLGDFLYRVRPGDTIYVTVEREGTTQEIALAPQAGNFLPV